MTPNPGSNEAIDQGCTCPVLDNCHGNMPDGNYWITEDCPLHGTRSLFITYYCSTCAFMATSRERLDEHLLNKHKVITK